MMTIAAVLLLVCLSSVGYDSYGFAVYASLAGIAVLVAAYYWRLNRWLAWILGAGIPAYIVLWYVVGSIYDPFNPPHRQFLQMLLPVLSASVFPALFFGWNRRIGTGLGVACGLLLGRTLLVVVPSISYADIYPDIYAPHVVSLVFVAIIPGLIGALAGTDVGAFADSRSGLWRKLPSWIVVGILAATIVGFRVYDVASGSYSAYTVEELSLMGNDTALVRIVRTSNSWRQRMSAVMALSRRPGPGAVEAVIRRLTVDSCPRVRSSASHRLYIFIYESDRTTRERELAALIQALHDPTREVRAEAIHDLQLYAGDYSTEVDPSIIQAFVAALHNEDGVVQRQAAHALIWMHDKRVFDLLVACLDDPRSRTCAAWSLAELKDKRALPYLLPLFSADENTADAAIEAVRKLHDRRAIPHLLNVLKGERFGLWKVAAQGAAELGAEAQAEQVLRAHLHSNENYKRYEADMIISKHCRWETQ